MSEKVINMIHKTVIVKCNHEIEISVFYHGGGFTPTITAYPELICKNRGLNVTIYQETPKKLERAIGIKMSKLALDKLHKWASICLKNNKVKSASGIIGNPMRALEQSEKLPYKLSFKVVDIKKFEKATGK